MVARTSRRLPGFRFETQSPPLTDVLPRMDVAVFVGFAASGPIHKPVAVEDIAQFTAIFGNDFPLAWDRQQSEQVTAYLAPAVRAFFRNGGRRCWVVRVASEKAEYNHFPLPGMVQVTGNGQWNIVQAFAPARSQGSWSDNMSVSTSLLSLPVAVTSLEATKPLMIDLQPAAQDDVIVGDLLRLTFRNAQVLALVLVQSIQSLTDAKTGKTSKDAVAPGTMRATGEQACWFSTLLPPPVKTEVEVTLFTYVDTTGGTSNTAQIQPGVQEQSVSGTYTVSGPDDNQVIELLLPLSLPVLPQPGAVVRLDNSDGPIFMTVQTVDSIYVQSSPPTEMLMLQGQGLLLLGDAPAEITARTPAACERLTFELWTRQSSDAPTLISNLAFGADHPRYWGELPTDEQLYDLTEAPSSTIPVNLWQARPSNAIYTALWQEASTPRFSLAGIVDTQDGTNAVQDTQNGQATDFFYLPLGIGVLPEDFMHAESHAARLTALERDGLDTFGSALFLDPRLQDTQATDLLAEADFIGYQILDPRPLQGIYATLAIAEVTLVAAPDAVHRGWDLAEVEGSFVEPIQAVCPPEAVPVQCESQQSLFFSCEQRVIPPPTLLVVEPPDDLNTFTLNWFTSSTGNDVSFLLQEASDQCFGDITSLYTSKNDLLTLYGRSPGDYYYRVHVTIDGVTSDWSVGLHVHLAPSARWQLRAKSAYTGDTLAALHRALLRLCAARGDMCTLLTFPEHYYAADVIEHVTRLKAGTDPGQGDVPPLLGEPLAFSYGSLYHPWLLALDDVVTGEVKRIPPDGVVCGMIAQRAIERGAWIAPANVALLGVVGLTPPISRSYWLQLQNIQVNLIRQEPRGFVVLNADTLSDDEDLRPFNVRRLLILLRRQALLQGANYVFEPNDDSFRRLVQRSFEATLEQMFVRGAFAGSTPESAFQVRVDETLNTPQSVDQGQFIVELRVAPSLPLTFMTVRLVIQPNGNTVTGV